MLTHIRACLWLLVLTVIVCCVIYPLSLWIVGQTLMPLQANGSIIYDDAGNPVGSALIAQGFTSDEYFQSRPSAAGTNGYDAAASGATNYGANNYLLRDKVARALAPLVKYGTGPKPGQPVAPDIVTWFRSKPGLVADWASAHATLAQNWVTSDEAAGKFVEDWFAKKPARREEWKADLPDKADPAPKDLAVAFFKSFSKEHPGTWLAINETKNAKGEKVKQVDLIEKSAEDSGDIAAVFFDMWRQEHPDTKLEEVPADLVTASASGLDPHITLKSALYQLDRVAEKRAKEPGRDLAKVKADIEALLRARASAPLFGLAGVQMVNVLEVNLALDKMYPVKKQAK
jgi:K+-transporting ATPase ATPase C chain